MTGCPAFGALSCTSRSRKRSSERAVRTRAARWRNSRTTSPPRRRLTVHRRAIEYSLLAGRAALAALDFDEAQERFSSALDLGIEDPARRAQTYLELGTACFRGGRSGDAMDAYRARRKIARALGDAQLLATAAVGYEDACWRPGTTDEGAVELLEEASLALGRRRLRAAREAARRASPARTPSPATTGRAPYVEEQAIAMARRARRSARARDRADALVLVARRRRPRGDARDAVRGPRDRRGDSARPTLQTEAMEWRVASLIALGDLQAAERELDEVHALAGPLRQPFTLHVAEHYAVDARALHGQARRRRRRRAALARVEPTAHGSAAPGIHGIQMFGIRREQGRLAELAATIKALGRRDRASAAWRPGFAALLAELGMETEVRRELARVRDEGFDELRSTLWVGSLSYLTDACAAVGDRSMAELVYPELAPLAGGNIVDRARSRVLRRGRPLSRVCSPRRSAITTRAIEHFEQALARQPRDGSHDLGRPHAVRVRPDAADARQRRRRARGVGAAVRGGDARGADRDADVVGTHPCARSAGRTTRTHGAGRPVLARGRDPAPRRCRPQQPRDRRAAVHQRPHGRQPRAQHPAQDRRREPHRGRRLRVSPRPGRAGPTRGRIDAMPMYVIERTFAEQLEMTATTCS